MPQWIPSVHGGGVPQWIPSEHAAGSVCSSAPPSVAIVGAATFTTVGRVIMAGCCVAGVIVI